MPKAPDEEGGPAAKWGHEVHRWVETGEATERVAKWLADITDDPAALREEYWNGGLHEVPVGILSMEISGEAAFLEPPVSEEAFAAFKADKPIRGVIDHVGASLVPTISDLKTGRNPPDRPPREIPQLLFYGLCWLRTHPDEPGVFLAIDHWPRYPKGQRPTRIGPDYVSRSEIEGWFADQVIPAYRLSRRPEAHTDARPGPHCQYCRSAMHCPAL